MLGFTPPTEDSSNAAKSLRKALDAQSRRNRDPKRYESFKHAIEARMAIVSTYPGKQSLSFEAAKALVSGSTYVQTIMPIDTSTGDDRHRLDHLSSVHTIPVPALGPSPAPSPSPGLGPGPGLFSGSGSGPTDASIAGELLLRPCPVGLTQGPVYFRHDSRLMLPSFTYLNNQQVKSFIDAIDTKVIVQLVCGAHQYSISI